MLGPCVLTILEFNQVHMAPSQYPETLKNHSDEHVLLDGDEQAYVRPTYGVQQGCPLSPLLFSTYLNDISDTSEGSEGACTGTPNFHVLNLLYADDLCLTSNSPSTPQAVLHLLPYSNTFRYLGMMFGKYINLHNAAEEALKPCLATCNLQAACNLKHGSRAYFAHQHQITHRLHAYLWLFKAYVIPAGMCASQIRATSYLQQGIEMDNSIQEWLLRSLRFMLGVRTSTPSWSIPRECGIEPIQFIWFRACSRSYNSLIHCNSRLLQKIFRIGISLSVPGTLPHAGLHTFFPP
eukprot:1136898-Pelagomonas_calceolata.AAC.1